MTSHFVFQLHNTVLYGVGRSRELGGFIRDRRFKTVMLLVDEGVAAHSPYWTEVRTLIEAVTATSCIVLRGNEEPDYDYLDLVAAQARTLPRPDLVIGVGGGSTLDISKAVAVLLTNPGSGIAYRGFDKISTPGVPTMLVPTTAGTGSEVTVNAVFTDKKEMRKLGINGRYMSATWALLDAEWTLSCPTAAAVSAGVDALTHTLESFMCRQHNALTRVFSREAFRLLYNDLPAVIEDAENLERRQTLLLAAYLAGAALFNSGSGIAGAFSYPLGVHFKIPHGVCGGVFLCSVVAFNISRGYTDYAELLDVVEPGTNVSARHKSEHFLELLRSLCHRIGVPADLVRWGVTGEHAPQIDGMLLTLQGAFDQNPVAFSAQHDAPAMLRQHLPA